MRTLACIKQVPCSGTGMDTQRGVIIRSEGERGMNPHDESALELALRLRDMTGSKASVLTMGPAFAEEMLKNALELGADEAYLLTGAAFAGADVLATSHALATGIRHIGLPDVIICGEYTTDGGTGQTGAALAARLGLDCADSVSEVLRVSKEKLLIRQERADEGRAYLLEIKTPCLLMAKSGAFPLRLPSLRHKLAAKKKTVVTISPEELGGNGIHSFGLSGSGTRVEKIETVPGPPKRSLAKLTGEEAAGLILETVRRCGDE